MSLWLRNRGECVSVCLCPWLRILGVYLRVFTFLFPWLCKLVCVCVCVCLSLCISMSPSLRFPFWVCIGLYLRVCPPGFATWVYICACTCLCALWFGTLVWGHAGIIFKISSHNISRSSVGGKLVLLRHCMFHILKRYIRACAKN